MRTGSSSSPRHVRMAEAPGSSAVKTRSTHTRRAETARSIVVSSASSESRLNSTNYGTWEVPPYTICMLWPMADDVARG
eukprot:4787427-Prymnesium_polylepis.1